MSKMSWIHHELEEAETEINALTSRTFIGIEHHWTEDKELVH